jgi:hypothetical protein
MGMSIACPANAITNAPRTDGFGAQYAALISVYSWSKLHGVPFCVTTWQRHEHRTQSNSSALFAFVGGHFYGPPASADTTRAVEKHMQLAIMLKRGNGTVSIWNPVVRQWYWHATKPRLSWFTSHPEREQRHDLVVHVRRGDVGAHSQGRFLNNGLTAVCVMGALAQLPTGTQVHVSSQGRIEDFGALKRVPNVHFRLNEPLMETFHHMASASSLVIAASTLSATAAFLVAGRGGRVFAHPQALTMIGYAYAGMEVTDCTEGNPFYARAIAARRQGRATPALSRSSKTTTQTRASFTSSRTQRVAAARVVRE